MCSGRNFFRPGTRSGPRHGLGWVLASGLRTVARVQVGARSRVRSICRATSTTSSREPRLSRPNMCTSSRARTLDSSLGSEAPGIQCSSTRCALRRRTSASPDETSPRRVSVVGGVICAAFAALLFNRFSLRVRYARYTATMHGASGGVCARAYTPCACRLCRHEPRSESRPHGHSTRCWWV
jgi:hypothetical protein